MQIQNKTLSSTIQNQELSHVDNFKKNVAVTSIHNLTINHKNIIKNSLNTFTQSNLMFNKSLKNRYATTEL